ncbi:hypothetical protein AX14_012981 [Amanita brunnescens Koide BX004]|nr:hypothetical protein AX14_012981 [Amanita brunnescens Koide BX004]
MIAGRVQLQGNRPAKTRSSRSLRAITTDGCLYFLPKNVLPQSPRLVILELIMRYTCHDDAEEIIAGITSSMPIKMPSLLLANWGAVNDLTYMLDMFIRFVLMSLC